MKKIYRYNGYYNEFETGIACRGYEVIRETEFCFVIKNEDNGKDRFVLKNPRGKRFAYESKDIALASFKRRKDIQIKILERQLFLAKKYLKIANIKKEK